MVTVGQVRPVVSDGFYEATVRCCQSRRGRVWSAAAALTGKALGAQPWNTACRTGWSDRGGG